MAFTLPETKRPVRALGWIFSIFSWPILLTAIQARSLGDYEIQFVATIVGLCWFNVGALFIYLDYKFNS